VCGVAQAMGQEAGFTFTSAEQIWDEVRRVWPKGAGITYSRLEREGGLQWPCLDEHDPGQTILHTHAFVDGPKARLRCLEFRPAPEVTCSEYPYLLTTGRTLHQFNAGTMTMRTPGDVLRPADTVDIAPADAEALHIAEGQVVTMTSRHGAVRLPARIDSRVQAGQLFCTFHSTAEWVNAVTGPARDPLTGTPDYKVTAVRIGTD